MKISVVIPTYHAADTIVAALDSICQQTVRPAEIVVVDDCSTDDTVAVTESWFRGHASQLDGIAHRLIRLPENGGPALARNRGIAEAKGDWIAFLDGDDQWLPQKVEVQQAVIESDENITLLCAETLPLEPDVVHAQTLDGSVELSAWHYLPLQEFVYANPVATSTVLARRTALEDVGGFDEHFRGPEDYDLWLRLANCYQLAKIDAPLSLYRHVAGSLSMDDRTFLPQVLSVLEKAFAPEGALHDYAHLQKRAYAEKYSSASWMAFQRGARRKALAHLWKSYRLYPRRIQPEERDPLLRLKLLYLYLRGKCDGERRM